MNSLRSDVSEVISDDDKTSILKILRDHTATIIDTSEGKHLRKELYVVIKDEKGKTIGGLLGFTEYGWLNIDFLSVDKAHRKSGLGRHIMQLAEEEALKRDCVLVLVGTLESFAPGFYESVGYTKFDVRYDVYGNKGFMYKKELKTFND